MSKKEEGWIKISRKIDEWEWRSSPKHFTVFLWLLTNASHKKTKWRGMTIMPGQVVTGRKQLSEKLGLSERKIRTVLKNLKTTSEVTIKSYAKYSIITITNWDRYQMTDHQNDQQVTSKRPANDQQVTTFKNVKNVKNVRNKNILSFSATQKKEEEFTAIQQIIDYLNKKAGKNYTVNNKNTRSMIRARMADGFGIEDFKKVIDRKTLDWKFSEMNKFLRPQTLFSVSKFEGYLNEVDEEKLKQEKSKGLADRLGIPEEER